MGRLRAGGFRRRGGPSLCLRRRLRRTGRGRAPMTGQVEEAGDGPGPAGGSAPA